MSGHHDDNYIGLDEGRYFRHGERKPVRDAPHSVA